MTQPYLTMRYQSTTHAQCAVFQEVNGLLTQVGSDFGTIERSASAGDIPLAHNKVANWNGSLWAVAKGDIYKYDIANSGDWGLFYSPSAAIFAPFQSLGLVAGTLDNSGILVTGHMTAISSAVFITILDDETVIESAAKSTVPFYYTTENQMMNPLWHNGAVHWAGIQQSYGPGVSSYNPSSDSLSNNLLQPQLFFRYDEGRNQIAVHKGRLYSVYQYLPSPQLHLVRVDGPAMELMAILNSSIAGSNPSEIHQGNAIASIDGRLIVIAIGSPVTQGNPSEFFAYEIDINDAGEFVSFTDITSDVKPTAFATSVTPEGSQFSFRLDNVSDILGSGSVWEIEHGGVAEGTSVNIYQWRGVGQKLMQVGTGKDSWQHSRTSITTGAGGEYIFSGSGTLGCSGPLFAVNGADIDVTFKVYGDNIADVVLGIVYDKEGESCESLGTVIETTVGSIAEIYASGIVATMAGTPVTIKWAAASDGISTGDFPKVAGRVFK